MSDYVSVRVASETLKVPYVKIIRLIKSGKIKAIKADGGWGWNVCKKSLEDYQCEIA